MNNDRAIITAERVNQWFESAGYAYGVPINAAEIAPALDVVLKSELRADAVPAMYNMNLSAALAHLELFERYLDGEFPSVPAPVFEVITIDWENELTPGTIITGDDALKLCWHVSPTWRESVLRSEYGDDINIVQLRLTFSSESDEDTYRIERI